MKRGILNRKFWLWSICLLLGLAHSANAQLQLSIVGTSSGLGKYGRQSFIPVSTNECNEVRFLYFTNATVVETRENNFKEETFAYPWYSGDDRFLSTSNYYKWGRTNVYEYLRDTGPYLKEAEGTSEAAIRLHDYWNYDECTGYTNGIITYYLGLVNTDTNGYDEYQMSDYLNQLSNATSDFNNLSNVVCQIESYGSCSASYIYDAESMTAGWSPGLCYSYDWFTNLSSSLTLSPTTLSVVQNGGTAARPLDYTNYTTTSYGYGGPFSYNYATNLSGEYSTSKMMSEVHTNLLTTDPSSTNRKAFASIGYGETFYGAGRITATFSMPTEKYKKYTAKYKTITRTTKVLTNELPCTVTNILDIVESEFKFDGTGELWTTNLPPVGPPSVGWPIVYAEITFEPGCVTDECGKCLKPKLAGNNTGDGTDQANDGQLALASLSLGDDGYGGESGQMKIMSYPGNVLAMTDPASLSLLIDESLVSVSEDGGVVTGLDSPQTTVQVLATNDFAYQLRFYNVSNGVALTNSGPFVTWMVTNVGNSTNFPATIRLVETRGGADVTTDFSFGTNGQIVAVARGSNLTKMVKTDEMVGDYRVMTWTTLRPSDDAIISVRSEKYLGGYLVESSRGTGADKVTDTFSFSTNRLILTNLYHSGGWSVVLKDAQERVLKEFSPFQSSTVTTNASNCRVREYGYTAVGGGDDGSFMPNAPRVIVEKILGTEVSRQYKVYTEFEERDIRCPNPGMDWDDADNLVTVTKRYEEGDFLRWPKSVVQPNGVLTLYEYEIDVVTNFVTTVYVGAPNGDNTAVTNGVKTVTIQGPLREMLSVSRIDIASNILIDQETYGDFDLLKRPLKITYLNGSMRTFLYSCCNLESETDENGITTSYTYDALKRRTSSTRAGVSNIQVYDAVDRVVASYQQGTNSTLLLMSSNVFNTANEVVLSIDALENETAYSRGLDGSSVWTQTVTYADGATGVQSYFRDGSQKSVGGTANHGSRYEYGVEAEGGVARKYTKQIRLLTNGTDSSEWVKSYTDAVGNSYKMLYPDEAVNVTYFNSKGQAWKQVDADGVVRLSQYNTKGEREYSVLDVDRDDVVDFSGNDRITRTLSYATNAHGVGVVRSETWEWQTLGANTPVLLSTLDQSVETQETWQYSFGLTNYSIHACVTNLVVCYSTNVAPDGSYTVSMSQYGLPLASTSYASNGMQLAQQSMGYDEFNRTITITDARTGTITNTLDALGRTLTRTTPAPAPGLNPQTTQTDYDVRGRLWRVIEPDGGVVVTTYHPTGEIKRKVGNRTYPVDYTYDYAGRMKTLKTWQDYSSDSGAAVTTWSYDSQRGFMTAKRYQDNKGPDYEYTLSGKLAKRMWARGVETVYTYNNAGDLELVDYSDGTPDVTYTYDRVGQKATVEQGSQDAMTLHYTAAGHLAAEQHTSGLLSGITVTNDYDGLLRRTGLTVLTNGGLVYQALYGYDAASRMLTVSDGTNNATYGYVTNSSLVAEIAFKQNSTLRMTTTKQYDLLNRLTNISSTTASFTNAFAYLYNDANQRTKVTREDGSYWNYAYDDLGQVTSGKRYWADHTPVAGQQYDYDFDDIGNRKSTSSNSKPETRNSFYTASLLNQYTSRTVPGYADVLGTAHSNATVTVNYERAARKGEYWYRELSLNNQGQAVYAGITNIAVLNDGINPDIGTTNTGKLFLPQTPEQFAYDHDGNLTGDGRWTYTWDGENRLIQMETKTGAVSAGAQKQKVELVYDDRWRMIQKKVSDWNGASYTPAYTNRFIYDEWNIVALFDSGNLRQSMQWGLDLSGQTQGAGGVGGMLALQDATNNETHFAAYDGNGNLSLLVSALNALQTAAYSYGPFGEEIGLVGGFSRENLIRFATKLYNKESGDYWFGYRHYSPNRGVWLSRDPLAEEGGENLYGFVSNSPLNQIDLLGLCGGCTCKSVSITFEKGGKSPKVTFYPIPDGFGNINYRYGFIIIIAWTVEGYPGSCKYFLKEASGGVTGETPKGGVDPSNGTFDQWQQVNQVQPDPLGIPKTKGPGEYKIKVDMTQYYKCVSSDGTEVVSSKKIKISDSEKWKDPKPKEK